MLRLCVGVVSLRSVQSSLNTLDRPKVVAGRHYRLHGILSRKVHHWFFLDDYRYATGVIVEIGLTGSNQNKSGGPHLLRGYDQPCYDYCVGVGPLRSVQRPLNTLERPKEKRWY